MRDLEQAKAAEAKASAELRKVAEIEKHRKEVEGHLKKMMAHFPKTHAKVLQAKAKLNAITAEMLEMQVRNEVTAGHNCKSHHFSVEESSFSIEESSFQYLKTSPLLLTALSDGQSDLSTC